MNHEIIIDTTINEVAAIINTAARGLAVHNREASQALMGCSATIAKKREDIRKNIVEKLDL